MSDAFDTERYFNREVSWLDFAARVLAMAEDSFSPLLERARFLAIFANHLDEFYMVRVAGLKRQQAAGLASRSPDGLTPREQLAEIAVRSRPLALQHARLFVDEVMPALAKSGVEIQRWADLSDGHRQEMCEYFIERVFPVVTPLAVDPGHPFPYISNRSLNLAVLVKDLVTDRTHFARVKVPPLLPRFIATSDEGILVPIEDVIAANLTSLFPGLDVVEHHAFRVTRNADLEVNDDGAEDLLQALEEHLQRSRFSPAVRLEIESGMSRAVLHLLMREFEVGEDDVHELPGPLDLSGLWELLSLDRPDLKDEPVTPVTHPDLTASEDPADVFSVLRQTDVLVHHPYHSFSTSVLRFIEEAADDPDVLAIKLTLYRTSGTAIVEALIEAAEAGKQVVVLVEIKARFDERANIEWARQLERAGCHVVYGMLGLKTHCKLCLVVRQEPDRLRRYVHIGTGNYNPQTSRWYEDLGLMTASDELGSDLSDLFNVLTGYSRKTKYRSLMVAPYGMREHLIELIASEAGRSTAKRPGKIVMKVNSLVDDEVIEALYAASNAGVEIDLIVRSICSLRPGVPGLSENITVRSIVGKFLEHSRIYYFRNGTGGEFYIGSADVMQRNLDRRVEALVKIESRHIRRELKRILETNLLDNTGSWILQADGAWARVSPGPDERASNAQSQFMARAITRSHRHA